MSKKNYLKKVVKWLSALGNRGFFGFKISSDDIKKKRYLPEVNNTPPMPKCKPPKKCNWGPTKAEHQRLIKELNRLHPSWRCYGSKRYLNKEMVLNYLWLQRN